MPLPLIVGVAVRVGIAAAGRIIAKRAATAAAKKAAEAAAKKAAEEAAKKAATQGLGRQAGTAATRDAAKKAAQESLKKSAGKGGGKGPGNTAGKHKAKKSKKDPCKHPNDKKKRTYVVYKVKDRSGNVYVGRTSGAPGESVRTILARRSAGHHRADVRGLKLEEVFSTDRYAAVRGAEQIAKEKYSTAKQIEPISDRNKRREDYLDCAKSKI
jgi:hypothetical protein